MDNVKKASDDGEPTGTAGIPILQVLEKNQLNHVLCIVVRYFGKIKLGANGLVRAYTKSVVECLKENIILLQKGFFITISFDYSILKKVDYLVQDALIVEKNYEEKIIYQLYSSEQLLEQLQMLPTLVVKMRRPCYF